MIVRERNAKVFPGLCIIYGLITMENDRLSINPSRKFTNYRLIMKDNNRS